MNVAKRIIIAKTVVAIRRVCMAGAERATADEEVAETVETVLPFCVLDSFPLAALLEFVIL